MSEPIAENVPAPEESGPALSAFEVYIAMGPTRSLAKLAKQMGHPASYVRRLEVWSARYGWQARCKAHDTAIALEAMEREKESRTAEVIKRREDRLKIAALLRKKAVAYLLAHDLDVKVTVSPETGVKDYVPPADRDYLNAIVRMLEYADKTERLDLGEVTERTETMARESIAEMSNEELIQAAEATMARLRSAKKEESDEE